MEGSKPTDIVLLGGSFAGLTLAHQLLRKVLPQLGTTKGSPKYRVILVSPSTHLYWNIGAPRAICSPKLVPWKKAFWPFLDEFKQYPAEQFQFIQGTATDIDLKQRYVIVTEVHTSDPRRYYASESSTAVECPTHTIQYHALIIATGSSAHSPLLSLHGKHERTQHALEQFHSSLTTASSVVIVGGGPSGVECAGQLATWVGGTRRRHQSRVSESYPAASRFKKLFRCFEYQEELPATPSVLPKHPIKITLISGNDRLLPRLDPQCGFKAEMQLKSMGVQIIHNVRLLSAQELPSRVTRCILTNDIIISSDLFIAATGMSPNTNFLPEECLDAKGYVIVDPHFRLPKAIGDRVYCIGGCCSLAKNTILDVFQSIPALLRNLRNDLLEWEIRLQHPYGGGEDRLKFLQDMWFKPDESVTLMCPITRYGGVGMLFGHAMPSLLVWALKGRDYNFGRAKKLVKAGKTPFPTK